MTEWTAAEAIPARILVVDDEQPFLMWLREALRSSSRWIEVATSVEQALGLLETDQYDLVLTDIRLSGIRSGLDLVQELSERLPSLPVLVMTGDGNSSLVSEALDRGAAGFLAKPFGVAELREKVERALRRATQAEADVRERLVRPTIATALANAIEVKDAHIHGHVERLAEIALTIGRRLGLSKHELSALELSAVLHDVGKIGIPDRILLKPASLTDDEREVMKAHAVIGDQMLRQLDLDEIRPAVRHHHERWDGNGYPDRLAGERIPLLARIVAVADSIEAMTAHRPYRDPLPLRRVKEELVDGRGRQWDPQIVDIAQELIAENALDLGPGHEARPPERETPPPVFSAA